MKSSEKNTNDFGKTGKHVAIVWARSTHRG